MAVPAPPAPPAPSAAPARRESDVALSVFLVLLLASTALAWPLRGSEAAWAIAVVRLLTLVVGVAALAPSRPLATAAALAALAAAVAQVTSGDHGPAELLSRIAFFAVTGGALLARVFRPGRITVHRILGAVAVYVLLAVLWGEAYQLVIVARPDAIRAAAGPATLDDAMWLSFVTLTTTGYGDVLPASATARSLAAIEAMVGVLFPAILVSRLVSLVQGTAARGERSGGAPTEG